LYFVVITLLTIGLGDYVPSGPNKHMLEMITMVRISYGVLSPLAARWRGIPRGAVGLHIPGAWDRHVAHPPTQ
jgi:hypothetical protein